MGYFNDVISTFLSIEHVSCFAVQGQKALGFHQKYCILICVPNMNKGLMGLEQQKGE